MTDQPDPRAALRRKVGKLAQLPGVYLMKSAEGDVLYVGKAKDLRARVRSYFAGGDGRIQIEYLMKRVEQVDTIVTKTEEQAIVLERDLISKYKPRFNIKLKDDKAYLSIRIDENAPWPRIELVRKVTQDGARYLGPFAWSNELRGLLEAIKKIVPLRSCADTVFYNRQRPCLEYQIRRCAGPCCLPVDRTQYGEWVTQAVNILEGKTRQTLMRLRELMEAASEDLRFEEAAAWRDRIEILENFEAGHNLISRRAEDRDVLGFWREGQQASVCILFVRYGRISDSKVFSFGDLFLDNEELLSSVIEQFYRDDQVVPPEILLPMELQNSSLVAAALKLRSGHAVELLVPQRGSKMRLIEIANLNARQHFLGHLAVDAAWSSLSSEIAQRFQLSQAPRKVECIDISNFQGSDIVGAVVCFFDGAPEKSGYRNYEISFQEKPDDFRAVHEVVTRRLTRGLERGDLPDLLVIDGGPGQLAMAYRAREEVGAQIDIISIAKMRTESDVRSADLKRKPERIYLAPTSDPIELIEGERVTGFFQRLRDETHRFVISRHRERRGRRAVRSVLDGLPGITPERRRRLLVHFGSVEKLLGADVDEIAKVGRMPKGLAEKVMRALGADGLKRTDNF
jgi:excinuclease ABC subunit C